MTTLRDHLESRDIAVSPRNRNGLVEMPDSPATDPTVSWAESLTGALRILLSRGTDAMTTPPSISAAAGSLTALAAVQAQTIAEAFLRRLNGGRRA